MLAIPNIVLQPGLDEVQAAVTKSAHSIVHVATGVSQWNKDRVKAKIMSKKSDGSTHGEYCILIWSCLLLLLLGRQLCIYGYKLLVYCYIAVGDIIQLCKIICKSYFFALRKCSQICNI